MDIKEKLKEEIKKELLTEISALVPTNKKAVIGENLPKIAEIMAGYSDFNDKGVVGGYSGTFPLSSATQGGIYLVPQTGKFYVCETAYNGSQISAPNSSFVELSVWKNHDRLANLFEIKDIVSSEYNDIGSIREFAFTINNPEKLISVIPHDTANTSQEYYSLLGKTIYAGTNLDSYSPTAHKLRVIFLK